MPDLHKLNKIDPLTRRVEKQSESEEFSPMDPPDAFSPPNSDAIPYEEMHPFLQGLADEHKSFIEELDRFENALNEIRDQGLSREIFDRIAGFFRFFDQEVIGHNRREERHLFPLLHTRLIESGEHSKGEQLHTGVTHLEEEHLKSLQQAAIVFNFLAMAMRLPDSNSRLILLDAALEQGKVLIEEMRLHIFREENIAFVQAQHLISAQEFDEMTK